MILFYVKSDQIVIHLIHMSLPLKHQKSTKRELESLGQISRNIKPSELCGKC